MVEEGHPYMDERLYNAARIRGTQIPSNINDHHLINSRTPGIHNNALHIAALYGNIEFITTILSRLREGYHLLCQQNSKGETPLHLAAQSGNGETVATLLRAHDDVDSAFANQKKPCWSERDKNGDTPIHTALKYGHEDIALSLLGRDIQLASIHNHAGESLAYLAADYFCRRVLERILEADRNGECSVSFSGPFRQTVFHSARRLTKTIMSKLIERRRPLLKAQDNKGKTVAHYAVEENMELIVKTLLAAESSLAYVHDNDGLTPLHIAANKGFFPMVRTILDLSPQSLEICDNISNKTALHMANMNAGFIAKCLKNTRMKELINHADNDGNTPLHLALINSNPDIVDTLLEVGGINWRLKNNQGLTPMDLCKSDNRIPVQLKRFASQWRVTNEVNMEVFYPRNVVDVDDLLNHCTWGKCLSYRGHRGDNILHIAAKDGSMKILNDPGMKDCLHLLSEVNFIGETPLHLAAEHGKFDVVKAIQSLFISSTRISPSLHGIEDGAQNQLANNIKPWLMKSANGDTPAHKALKNRHAKIALFLLQLEPELVHFVNSEGASLLYLAADNCCHDVICHILQLQRCSFSGRGGQNPLHAAARNAESEFPRCSFSGPGGQNPLHAAARNAEGRSVTKLIEKRSDLVKMVDENSKTPLHYAAEKGRQVIVRELLDEDKSAAFVYDNEGFTPLLRAAANGYSLSVIAILTRCPHSIELRDVDNNRTVLHLAKMSRLALQECMGHQSMVKLINEIDRDGNTPLHCSILEGDEHKALFLLKTEGVNWRIRNKQDQSPLDLCKQMFTNADVEQPRIFIAISNLDKHWIERAKLTVELLRVRMISSARWSLFHVDLEIMKDDDLKQLLNNVALTSALLVSLTFTAATHVPGGYDSDTGYPKLMDLVSFKVFMVSDVVAMLTGITVLIQYTFGIGKCIDKTRLTRSCIVLLQISLFATILAFASGVLTTVLPLFPAKLKPVAAITAFFFPIFALEWFFIMHTSLAIFRKID